MHNQTTLTRAHTIFQLHLRAAPVRVYFLTKLTNTHTDEETNTRRRVCTVKQPTYWITHFYSCLNAVVCRRAIPKQHILFCVLYYCSYYRHLLALQFAFLCLLLSFYIHSGSHRTDMTILCLSCDKTAANSLNSLHTLYIVSLHCATTYSRHVRLRISPLRLPSSYVSSLSVSGAVSIWLLKEIFSAILPNRQRHRTKWYADSGLCWVAMVQAASHSAIQKSLTIIK